MTHARVRVSAVLDAAQNIIDQHVTSPECFGRCVKCGDAWPCAARSQAGTSFYTSGRLPRRAPTRSVDSDGVPWSPVDWFGSGRVTTIARGEPVPGVWRLRAASA